MSTSPPSSATTVPMCGALRRRACLLQILDQSWKDHLLTLDHLRQGIGLRAYGQRDPLNEYKAESFEMFENMLASLREQTTQLLSHVELRVAGPDEEDSPVPERRAPQMQETRREPALASAGAGASADGPPALPPGGGGGRAPAPREAGEPALAAAGNGTVRRAAFDQRNPETWSRVGRNAPCPWAPAASSSAATARSPDPAFSFLQNEDNSAQPLESKED